VKVLARFAVAARRDTDGALVIGKNRSESKQMLTQVNKSYSFGPDQAIAVRMRDQVI
jgi:hypothetical protein